MEGVMEQARKIEPVVIRETIESESAAVGLVEDVSARLTRLETELAQMGSGTDDLEQFLSDQYSDLDRAASYLRNKMEHNEENGLARALNRAVTAALQA